MKESAKMEHTIEEAGKWMDFKMDRIEEAHLQNN